MSNVTDLPTSASRGASGAPGGSCRSTISSGAAGLLPPTAASAPSPASVGSMISVRSPRHRRGPLGEAGRGDDVRGRVDELAGGVGPAADERGAVGHGRELVAAPQITKRSTPRGGSPLRQRRRVVAADDGAFGQRAHLLLDGRGSDGSSAHATVPPSRHARTARAAAVRSPSAPGSSATTASGAAAAYTIATGSASATARSGAPSSDARAPPRRRPDRPRPRTGRRPSLRRSRERPRHSKGGTMTWVKPKFEIVELCSEVTSYLFQR